MWALTFVDRNRPSGPRMKLMIKNELNELLPVQLLHFRLLQRTQNCTPPLNINCVDPLGRTALLMAIDNENLEMVELLIENKVGG